MNSVLSVENGKLYERFGLLKVELACGKRGGTLVKKAVVRAGAFCR